MAESQPVHENTYKRHKKIVQCFSEVEALGFASVNAELLSRRTLQICLDIKDQQDFLMNSFINVWNILDVEEELYTTHSDPSVQYFGLEWSTVYKRCKKIQFHLAQFWGLIDRSEEETSNILSILLSELNILKEEVVGHLEAVTKSKTDTVTEGNTSSENIEHDIIDKRRITTSPPRRKISLSNRTFHSLLIKLKNR